MSHGYKGTGAADREALAATLDKAHLYPKRGEHVGRRAAEGPPIQRTWNGTGPVPLGWASYQAHRTDPEETIWLPEPETATKLARLTPQEQAQLTAARLAAEPDPVKDEGAEAVASAKAKARA